MANSFQQALAQLEVHGHRGCRGLRPENTLPAFIHALELGVDVLELDVVISADRQVVVSHEPWLNPLICRGPNGEPIPVEDALEFNLYRMPYQQIQKCDCGRPHPNFPNQQSTPAFKPLLRDVLAATELWAAQQLGPRLPGYSIEVKSLPDGDDAFHPAPSDFLQLVLAELEFANITSRTTLLCFDPRILRLAHQLRPAQFRFYTNHVWTQPQHRDGLGSERIAWALPWLTHCALDCKRVFRFRTAITAESCRHHHRLSRPLTGPLAS